MNGRQGIKVGRVETCQKVLPHPTTETPLDVKDDIEPEVEQLPLAPLPSDFQLNVLTYSSTNDPFRPSRMDQWIDRTTNWSPVSDNSWVGWSGTIAYTCLYEAIRRQTD
jgi:hypothetical protein